MSFSAFDISASGLYAQRVKMDTIASNIANVNTTRNPDGTPGPYRRKEVVFQAIYQDAMNQYISPSSSNNSFSVPSIPDMSAAIKSQMNSGSTNMASGVSVSQILEDNSDFKKEYNPSHPDADIDGFVALPNVNIVTEMVDMITASRAYEANITTLDTAKNMFASALRI